MKSGDSRRWEGTGSGFRGHVHYGRGKSGIQTQTEVGLHKGTRSDSEAREGERRGLRDGERQRAPGVLERWQRKAGVGQVQAREWTARSPPHRHSSTLGL